ncbi:ABC transporter substrate-binding protein [Bdellovibrio reynosensis]|uniref:ABC transporter substrate-binding protein n=1 Tax=Bdellovibrio reynosensis TaxID=2835041 RepID=A0ABY4C7F7_9BACT|nr:ABC transporter substrate-binding protein [Bdellovibrio reynosensis]UOF00828.1 ABC transporter substrate-binding protein [Bdellovibrio reynosensis]
MNTIVRIPFYSTLNIESLDPSNITDGVQYQVLNSIYSSLLYYDSAGRLQGAIAESFETKNDRITFSIRRGIKTIDGDEITAEDVYLSYKRLLILNRNFHGRLIDFLDCEILPKRLSDSCSGLNWRDNKVEFKLKSPDYIVFFLPLVAGADYSIIPKKSLDPVTLKIIDYKNTSGPYFVSSTNNEKTIFSINLSNPLASMKNPTHVHLLNEIGANKIEMLNRGIVDILPTFTLVFKKNLEQISAIEEYNLYKTLPIRLTVLVFTDMGLKKLSSEQRIVVGKILKAAYLNKFKDSLELTETQEYFSIVGEGAIEPEQYEIIKNTFENAPTHINETVTADFADFLSRKGKEEIINSLPNFKFKELGEVEGLKSPDAPDVFSIATDAGGFDNLSLLNYTHSLNGFGMSDDEFTVWLSDYLKTSDRSDRLQKFRNLHFNMLNNGQIIPVGVSSFLAIAKKPWKFDGNPAFAVTPFWTIKHE